MLDVLTSYNLVSYVDLYIFKSLFIVHSGVPSTSLPPPPSILPHSPSLFPSPLHLSSLPSLPPLSSSLYTSILHVLGIWECTDRVQ